MRKVFLDCGANDGRSVEMFRKHFTDYEIYCFEANPKIKWNIDVPLIRKAVWIFDGEIKFYKGSSLASSIFKNKTTGNLSKKPIVIPCLDFSKWILNNFTKQDEIILKLDIEGAEYKVLDKMILDDSISLISKLYIDWHYMKIGLSKEEHDRLVSRLLTNLIPLSWSTESGIFGSINV